MESVLLDQQPSLLTLRRRAFRLCSNDSSASDFASVMAPVRAGAEIVIDRLGLRSRRGRNHQEPQTVGSASAGVILDSSVIIAAERRGRTVRQILELMTAPGTTESR